MDVDRDLAPAGFERWPRDVQWGFAAMVGFVVFVMTIIVVIVALVT